MYVLEGSNLWFCYQVIVGTHAVKTPARDLSSSSIQFNFQKENHKIVTEDGKVKVVLSHVCFWRYSLSKVKFGYSYVRKILCIIGRRSVLLL